MEAMVKRLEGAKEEISAAQGVVWENDFWNLVAKKLKMKRARFEKWSEITARVGGEGTLSRNGRPADEPEGRKEGGGGGVATGHEADAWVEPPLGGYQDNEQWVSDLFDGIDIDQMGFFDWPCN